MVKSAYHRACKNVVKSPNFNPDIAVNGIPENIINFIRRKTMFLYPRYNARIFSWAERRFMPLNIIQLLTLMRLTLYIYLL